ncbi:hypothetical protein EDB80DRAFT_744665 [Ilyonectria destructans]|nr:hypothetical protein EDB80DRAFT_744665 [Ilyonectria destructans]
MTPKQRSNGFQQAVLPASPPLTPPADSDLPNKFDLQPSSVTRDSRPLVAVIGVGYVGTHLVETFSRGFDTLGFDISDKRIQEVKSMFAGNERVRLSSNTNELQDATHFLISVPTLLRPDRSIDSSYLCSALQTVAAHARRGSTVVIESSVAIGMTRELLGPLAQACGFFVGMSPERVDPGRTEPPAFDIPKVVSGLDDIAPGSLDSILRLYSTVFNHVVPVSKPEVAEMTKLYENCQRMMCTAYANEMADACVPHGIDPYEVCEAAASKPFGYMPYTPGPGVGGHCIPINPYYLLSNSNFPLLSAATEAMWRRPADIAARAIETLEEAGLGQSKPRVLVVGVGFKPGQSTLSNSPGLDIIKSLAMSCKVDVSFADTLVPQEAVPQVLRLDDAGWNATTLETFDMILIATRQVGFEYGVLEELRGVRVEWACRKY